MKILSNHIIWAIFHLNSDGFLLQKEDVSDLEYIGYSCGYRIVER